MSLLSYTKIEIYQLRKSKKLFAIIICTLLLTLSVLIINTATTPVYENYNYMEVNNPTYSSNGYLYNYSFCGYVLNKNLAPESNVNLSFSNSSSQFFSYYLYSTSELQAARSIVLDQLNHDKIKTASNGTFSFKLNFNGALGDYMISAITNVVNELNYYIQYNVVNQQGSQSNQLNFANVNGVTLLPYYNLGNYGTAAVVYEHGNSSESYLVSYTAYSNVTQISSKANLGNFSKGTPHIIGDYSQILSMNEAMNVSIYINSVSNGTFIFEPSNNNFYSAFSSGLSMLIYLVSAMAVLLIVLLVSTTIYDRPMNEFYQSLPERRSDVILTSLIIGGVALALSAIISYLVALILAFFLYSTILQLSPLFTLLAFVFSLYLVFSPIFYFIGTTRIFGTAVKFLISFLLILAVPIFIVLFSTTVLASTIDPYSQNYSVLFLPTLNGVREFNLISSLIPIISPIEMLNYMLKTPFLSTVMINHQSVLYLTPLIILPSFAYWFIPLIYLTIKRYRKI